MEYVLEKVQWRQDGRDKMQVGSDGSVCTCTCTCAYVPSWLSLRLPEVLVRL